MIELTACAVDVFRGVSFTMVLFTAPWYDQLTDEECAEGIGHRAFNYYHN